MLTPFLDEFFNRLSLTKEQEKEVRKMLYEYRSNKDLFESDPEDLLPRNFESKDLSVEESSSSNKTTNPGGTLHHFISSPPSPSVSLTSQKKLEPIEEAPKEKKKIGRYLDLGLLGKGGMGEVRKVHDPILNRTLAMKIIHSKLKGHPRTLNRFIEEAQIVAQLQHPNMLPVHELGKLPDGRYYFTMKEIDGRELSAVIKSVHGGTLNENLYSKASFRNLISIFRKVCETIAFAHSLGVIHRDLKPDNILTGDFGEVLVVDWGIAKVLGQGHADSSDAFIETRRSSSDISKTRIGAVTGTPVYMSPEQAHGQTTLIDKRSDIYTLGTILYEILSGLPPFQGQSVEDVLEMVRTTPAPSLRNMTLTDSEVVHFERTARPGLRPIEERDALIPSELIDICERAMCREQNDRFDDASQLSDAVQMWLEGAQRRDKALQTLSMALDERKKSRKMLDLAEEYWSKADQALSRVNESKQGWSIWRDVLIFRQKSNHHLRNYRRHLEGSLILDPTLSQAHAHWAALLIDEILMSTAAGSREEARQLRLRFNEHLVHLPQTEQGDLLEKLEAALLDVIGSRRAQTGRLIGRHQQQKKLIDRLKSGHRLLMLIGTAGVGKTRLALELTVKLKENRHHVFCDLTEARDALNVLRLIGDALNLKLGGSDSVQQIADALNGETPTVLILDNLEQCVDSIRPMIQSWLKQASSLIIIGTSRVRLAIPEEDANVIEPLSVLGAIEMFIHRGQESIQQLELTEVNRDEIHSICLELDCLPLAIELAASRLNMLSLSEIKNRIVERFSLLRSRQKGLPALQATLDWSWDLLQPWMKAALTQASVFRGGFTLSSAEGVIDIESWKDSPSLLDVLEDLCEFSLVRSQRTPEGTRFDMLDSIRAYASEKLSLADAVGHGLSGSFAVLHTTTRHADYFSSFGERKYILSLDAPENQKSLVGLQQELDNLVAGAYYGGAESSALCCIVAMKLLSSTGPIDLGLLMVDHVLNQGGLSSLSQCELGLLRARFLRISGRSSEAAEFLSKPILSEGDIKKVSAELCPSSGPYWDQESHYTDQEMLLFFDAKRLMECGNIAFNASDLDQAEQLYQSSMEHFRILHNRRGESLIWNGLGNVYSDKGFVDKSLDAYEKAKEIAHDIGFRRHEAICLSHIGGSLSSLKRFEEAIAVYKESIEIHKRMGNRVSLCHALGNLASAYNNLGQWERAVEMYESAVSIAIQSGNQKFVGINRGNLGVALLGSSRHDEGVSNLVQSVKVCSRTVPSFAGVFRSYLSLEYAKAGKRAESRYLLEYEEPEIEMLPIPFASVLFRKAESYFIIGDFELSAAHLTRLEGLIETHALDLDSALLENALQLKSRIERAVST